MDDDKEVFKNEVFQADVEPVSVSLLMKPGFYKVVWDNSHSWFRGKTVLFKFFVMSPMNPEISKD